MHVAAHACCCSLPATIGRHRGARRLPRDVSSGKRARAGERAYVIALCFRVGVELGLLHRLHGRGELCDAGSACARARSAPLAHGSVLEAGGKLILQGTAPLLRGGWQWLGGAHLCCSEQSKLDVPRVQHRFNAQLHSRFG